MRQNHRPVVQADKYNFAAQALVNLGLWQQTVALANTLFDKFGRDPNSKIFVGQSHMVTGGADDTAYAKPDLPATNSEQDVAQWLRGHEGTYALVDLICQRAQDTLGLAFVDSKAKPTRALLPRDPADLAAALGQGETILRQQTSHASKPHIPECITLEAAQGILNAAVPRAPRLMEPTEDSRANEVQTGRAYEAAARVLAHDIEQAIGTTASINTLFINQVQSVLSASEVVHLQKHQRQSRVNQTRA